MGSTVHALLASKTLWWFDLRRPLNSSLLSCNSPHPEITGSFEHRCRKSCQSPQPEVTCWHLLSSRGIFWRVGADFTWEPFEDYLRLILLSNTLLSPQTILRCKWFPAAFVENDRVCPASCSWNFCILLVGGWIHWYLKAKATEAESSQIGKSSSFEGRCETLPTFSFVSAASLCLFLSLFSYFLF